MDTAEAMAQAEQTLSEALVEGRDRMAVVSARWHRKLTHREKMNRKMQDRYARGERRTAQYERMKAAAPLSVERMRKWLKSPYAFRSGEFA